MAYTAVGIMLIKLRAHWKACRIRYRQACSLSCNNHLWYLGWVAFMLSCVTHCGHRDCSPSGSSVHGIFQTRILEFFRRKYWNWLPFPTPGDLLDPGVEPMSLASLALAGRFFTQSHLWSRELHHINPKIVILSWNCMCFPLTISCF